MSVVMMYLKSNRSKLRLLSMLTLVISVKHVDIVIKNDEMCCLSILSGLFVYVGCCSTNKVKNESDRHNPHQPS